MRVVLSLVVAASVVTACSSDDGAPSDAPTIVVTTSILGDVVEQMVGDTANVEVIMPRGADPHEFQPSTRQAEDMAAANLLVINGAGFEAGLDDAIGAAIDAGVPIYTFTDHVPLAELDGGLDPHIWTNPDNIADNIDPLVEAMINAGIVPDVRRTASRYELEVGRLATTIETMLDPIPAADRVLVTNHEVFGYFATRFQFEVIGTVVPSLTTGAESSAADVDELAQTIEDAGVPAIFADTSSPSDLAEALADAVGDDVEVVELYSESLGEEDGDAGTYIDMMLTDAQRILDALT